MPTYAWKKYMLYIQAQLAAPQGPHLQNSSGVPLVNGYWDYTGELTNYILNIVCQSTVCN
jgi:hypothetical protein